MQRRTFVVGAASASVSIPLAGCAGSSEPNVDPGSNSDGDDSPVDTTGASDEDASGDSTPEENAPEEEPADDTDEVAEPDPITLSGDGSTVTDAFDLIGGFAAADMEYVGYDGDRFRVRLIDEDGGDLVRELADETNEWSGEIGDTLDSGSYRLDVEADGEWSIEIRQPRPTSGETPPIEDDCKTSTVLGPYELGGEHQVTATHEGGGNFIVRAHDATANGTAVGNLLIHESGRFDGTETFSHEGLAWITIVVDGDWELGIE